MSSYIYLRGKALIKPELVEILRPRFTLREDGNEPQKSWNEIQLPFDLVNTVEFKALLDPQGVGERYPGIGWGSVDSGFEGFETAYWEALQSQVYGDNRTTPGSIMLFSEMGELTFVIGGKYYPTHDEFLKFIPMISTEWFIEEDDRDTGIFHHNNWKPKIYQSPLVIAPHHPFLFPEWAVIANGKLRPFTKEMSTSRVNGKPKYTKFWKLQGDKYVPVLSGVKPYK